MMYIMKFEQIYFGQDDVFQFHAIFSRQQLAQSEAFTLIRKTGAWTLTSFIA